MTDQAARLRALVEARLQGGEAAKGGPRLVAVASGKGGVGKTNLSLNLGLAMARRTGRSDVCLVDIDFGLANADVLCSVQPERTLADVLDGQCDMEDAMVLGPGACDCCLALAAGVAVPAWTSRIGAVWSNWRGLGEAASVVLFDCAAGIGRNVCAFTRSVDDLIIVTTPEPTALVDAYALVVAVADAPVVPRLHLVVNMAQDKAELDEVQERFLRTCDLFQGVTLEVHPGVPLDLWFAMPSANGCLLCCLTRIQRLRRRSIGSLDGFWGWRSPQNAAGGRDCGRNTKKFLIFPFVRFIRSPFPPMGRNASKGICDV